MFGTFVSSLSSNKICFCVYVVQKLISDHISCDVIGVYLKVVVVQSNSASHR